MILSHGVKCMAIIFVQYVCGYVETNLKLSRWATLLLINFWLILITFQVLLFTFEYF